MKLLRILLLLCLILIQRPAGAEVMTLHIGKHRIRAEIADTPHSQARGLKERIHLCADCGMLFVFKKAVRYDFWMKDTPLPLSIAFIASNGSILNIEEMQPNTTDIHSSAGAAQYVLEMNRGWFAIKGITSGHIVRELKPAPNRH